MFLVEILKIFIETHMNDTPENSSFIRRQNVHAQLEQTSMKKATNVQSSLSPREKSWLSIDVKCQNRMHFDAANVLKHKNMRKTFSYMWITCFFNQNQIGRIFMIVKKHSISSACEGKKWRISIFLFLIIIFNASD